MKNKKISDNMKLKWQDPEYRKKMLKSRSKPWNKGIKQTIAVKKKQSDTMKKLWENDEYRNKQKETRETQQYKTHMKKIRIGKNNPMYGKEIGEDQLALLRLDITKLKERYPIFYNVEKPRWNPIKKKIEVRCKYCEKWFIPNHTQFYERMRQIERGNSKSYLYCCDDHKFKCPYSYRISPEELTKYQKYNRIVMSETDKSLKKNGKYIPDLYLRGIDFHLDHKFSIKQGFRQNIDPKIIGHYKNLCIIPSRVNHQKYDTCSITLKELKQAAKGK